MSSVGGFTEIWIVVFAVANTPGAAPEPIRLAANGLLGGPMLDVAGLQLCQANCPPYSIGACSLIVTTNAKDLAGCHLALGWPMPARIIDLLVEWRCTTNGRADVAVGAIAGALLWHGLPVGGLSIDSATTEQLKSRLSAIRRLFRGMQHGLDFGRALLRGRYLCAVARIERTGIPIDRATLDALANDWPRARSQIIDHVNHGIGVYRNQTFDTDTFIEWLRRRGIAWPTNPLGQLDLSEPAFRDVARTYPAVRPLKEIQTTLDRFDPRKLAVGRDDRNRTPLRPFASQTGRNQPSAKASVFGSAAWVRHLIKPEPGTGIALLDWQQQEFGIAAALSGDAAMQRAYRSGDAYLALAVAAGAAPDDATVESHGDVRDRFKACALGVQYGMGAAALARQFGMSATDARHLLAQHQFAYPEFWRWSDAVETQANLHGELHSVFGWRVSVGSDANPRGLRNFPMQANGAEMLRLACCIATEAGIRICTTIHDAILIESPLDKFDDAVLHATQIMAEASAIVLDGFALRTDVKTVLAPDRWTDRRGATVWSAVESMFPSAGPPERERNATGAPTITRPISYMS